MNNITAHLSDLLEDEGYNAFAVPKSGKMIKLQFFTFHCCKSSRSWQIENNVLITPEVGAAVNWGTVLTDAPLMS